MYTHLFFVENWVKELTKNVKTLILERPYRLEVGPAGEAYYYEEITILQEPDFLAAYTAKALAVLREVDVYRDATLLSDLRNELRDGQFDGNRKQPLNQYVAKVKDLFYDLWMLGFAFDHFYSFDAPRRIVDVAHFDDGIQYYYEEEGLELGNILYRIRTFFKHAGFGYEADPDEYTLESVLMEFADYSGQEPNELSNEARLGKPSAKLQWKCKPAVAGYILSELIRAGYLEPPVSRGDLNLKQLARLCEQVFSFKDHNPTVESWRNVLDLDRNQLSELARLKLQLPDLDQLG